MLGALLAWCASACARSELESPLPHEPAGAAGSPPVVCDLDSDSYLALACGGDDCNDDDASIHPGAFDLNLVAGVWEEGARFQEPHQSLSGARTFTSMAADRAGVVHLVYNALSGIRHAWRSGATWRFEAVDALGAGTPALGLDAQDVPHAVYCAGTSLGLRHATRLASGWMSELIDTDCQGAPGISVESAGIVHAVYPASDGVRYATNRGGHWLTSRVDALSPDLAAATDYRRPTASIAVDASGVPHLAFAGVVGSQQAFRYATSASGSWRLETIDFGRGAYGSIALDPEGSPAVAFATSGVAEPGVAFAFRQSESWASSVVTAKPGAWDAWLAFDTEARAHLAFLDLNYGLAYAVRSGDAWSLESAFAEYTADLGASFTLDAARTAHAVTPVGRFDDTLEFRYTTNGHFKPDGRDQNCDGSDGVDADHDGHASVWTGGDDCDDADPSVGAAPVGPGEPLERCNP